MIGYRRGSTPIFEKTLPAPKDTYLNTSPPKESMEQEFWPIRNERTTASQKDGELHHRKSLRENQESGSGTTYSGFERTFGAPCAQSNKTRHPKGGGDIRGQLFALKAHARLGTYKTKGGQLKREGPRTLMKKKGVHPFQDQGDLEMGST